MVDIIISRRWLKGMTLHVEEHGNRQSTKNDASRSVPLYLSFLLLLFFFFRTDTSAGFSRTFNALVITFSNVRTARDYVTYKPRGVSPCVYMCVYVCVVAPTTSRSSFLVNVVETPGTSTSPR